MPTILHHEPTTADIAAARPRTKSRRNGWITRALSWIVFVAVHTAGMLYFGFSAYCYWVLPQSDVVRYLSFYGIGINAQHYRTIAFAYGVVAVIHAALIAQMVSLSAKRKCLVFHNRRQFGRRRGRKGKVMKRHGPVESAKQAAEAVYCAFFTADGLFGVDGPCFELILLIRESVETSLQTVQAYRMSRVLARAWINRFYVSLLVLNCWLTALVHSAFHRNTDLKYFVTLLCDFALDWVSSMVIPAILVFIYNNDRDPTASDFFGLKWFDDVWIINATNEFQLILVVSWSDLATRLMFALSMIGNLSTLKRFVSCATRAEASSHTRSRWHTIAPQPTHTSRQDNKALTTLKRTNNAVKNHPAVTKALRVLFIGWGALILIFHVQADFLELLPQCVMQIRPWGVSRPSCNLVMLDCHVDSMTGRSDEIESVLTPFDPHSIGKIFVRHCPQFEMPAVIQSLNNLRSVKMYNTSIASWDENAALTNTKHPLMTMVLLVRSNTTDGILPAGILATDFPKSLQIFGFINTNTRSLPDGLHVKWPPHSTIHFDSTELVEFPQVVLRMQPWLLILAGNQFETVPEELFEIPTMEFVHLGYTALSSLPTNVTNPSTALASMNLDGVNISSFPPWVDQWLEHKAASLYSLPISASGSPYCLERQQILSGTRSDFTASAESKSRLMDTSRSNWDFLSGAVACTPSVLYRYPLIFDDMFSAIK